MQQKSLLTSLFVSCAIGLCLGQPLLAYQNEIAQTAQTIATKLETSNAKTIAVVDFTDLSGNVTELGRFIAEELSAALAENGGLRVIDRIHLRSILQEHKLATTGLIERDTASKLGDIAGVQALVTGTIIPFGDYVRLSASVLDIATAQIYASAREDIPKTEAIETLLSRGVEPVGAGTVPRSAQNPSNQPVIQTEQTQQTQELSLQIEHCEVAENDILCHWLITNKDPEERHIWLLPAVCQVVMYDDKGREYQPSRLQIGSASDEKEIPKNLLSRVRTLASTRFRLAAAHEYQDSSQDLDVIAAIKISIYFSKSSTDKNGKCLDFNFRNIPLQIQNGR